MRRRDFIGLLGGAVSWPLVLHAQQSDGQQSEGMRHVGVLMSLAPDDPLGKARFAAFEQGFQQLGWVGGRNVRIEIRWSGGGKPDDARKYAAELIAFKPDVVLASGCAVVGPLLQVTRTVPIVFTQTPDPVAAGFVASLARPGGNATGFTQVEYGMAAKWLELLKEIAPRVTRAAILRDPAVPEGIGQFTVIQSAAPALKVTVTPIDIRNVGEIERALTEFARSDNGGLILTSSALANIRRDLIISLAAKFRLPAVYSFSRLASLRVPAALQPTGPIPSIRIGARPATLTASSRARIRLTCRSKHRPSMSLRSISKPQKRWDSQFRPQFFPAPTS